MAYRNDGGGSYRGAHFASEPSGASQEESYGVDRDQFAVDRSDYEVDRSQFADQTELVDRGYYTADQEQTQLVDPFSDRTVDPVADQPTSAGFAAGGARGYAPTAYDDGEYVADPRYSGGQYSAPAASPWQDQGHGVTYQQQYDPTAVYEQAAYQPDAEDQGGRSGRKKGSGAGTIVLAVILLVLGVALLVVAGHYFLTSQHEYQVGIDEYAEIQEAAVTEDSVSALPVVDFESLRAQNPEIVGWIQIGGTNISYPVARHEDNDYYLEHTFLGTYNLAGSIFMDYRSSAELDDKTTVIYGHHLKNGTMFAQLASFSDQSEFDKIGPIYYITYDGAVHVLTPLSCMVISGTEVDVLQFDFTDGAAFKSYVENLITRSRAYAPNATAEGVGHVYLLSTCSYERDNDRTILVCVDWGTQGTAIGDATGDLEDIQSAADTAVSEGDANVDWH